jgi:hypothetical protein
VVASEVRVVACVVDKETVVTDAPCDVKSNSTFVPVKVIVLLIGPKPLLEAVTVMVPEVGIGNA